MTKRRHSILPYFCYFHIVINHFNWKEPQNQRLHTYVTFETAGGYFGESEIYNDHKVINLHPESSPTLETVAWRNIYYRELRQNIKFHDRS